MVMMIPYGGVQAHLWWYGSRRYTDKVFFAAPGLRLLHCDGTMSGKPARNSGGSRITMFDKFHITFASAVTAAALGMFALPVAPSPASASICTDVINTTWSAPTDFGITTNQTSFTACDLTTAGESKLASTGVFTVDEDPYSVTVSAVDGDTFQLLGTISDAEPSGIGDSPIITLILSDIDWVGMSGFITAVNKSSGDLGTFAVSSFTNDSITISGTFSCGGVGDPACDLTDGNLGTFDLTVTQVPLPAALPLFLSALAGLGFVGWRGTKAAA